LGFHLLAIDDVTPNRCPDPAVAARRLRCEGPAVPAAGEGRHAPGTRRRPAGHTSSCNVHRACGHGKETAVSPFHYADGVLHAEALPLSAIAERFGTPCYVYSRSALESAYRRYDAAFAGHPHLVCYAVKANSNLAILNLFAREDCGFDIVSGGELKRVLAAGG